MKKKRGITNGVISVVLAWLFWHATPKGRSKRSVLHGLNMERLADMEEQTSAIVFSRIEISETDDSTKTSCVEDKQKRTKNGTLRNTIQS